MLISTIDDLKRALINFSYDDLIIENIQFSDYITCSAKIYSPNFTSSKIIDYRIAKIILAVQKEAIKAYNVLCDKNIKIEEIDKEDFFIVKFEIKDGCIEIFTKIAKKYYEKTIKECIDAIDKLEIFKNMTGKEKIIALFIVLLMFPAYHAPAIIKELRRNPEISSVLENNKEIVDLLSKNQEVNNVIINNLGDGYIEYDGKEYTKRDYEAAKFRPLDVSEPAPEIIDDVFFIQKYDFEGQEILIFAAGQESFWASTRWLGSTAREELKKITAEAIENQSVAKERMRLSCVFKRHKVKEAVVQDLGNNSGGTTDGKTFAAAIEESSPSKIKKRPSQPRLLD